MARRRLQVAAGSLGVLLALAAPISAGAALEVWTLVAVPPSATAGTPATFSLTASNLAVPAGIGCLEVDLPASFTNLTAQVTQTPGGRPWSLTVTGTNIVVHSLSGGGRIRLAESMSFSVTSTPTVAGVTSWANHAHLRKECDDADIVGVAVPVTVLPKTVPTPTPTVAPTSTPVPTAVPTPQPTQEPSMSATPRPSAPGTPTATPTRPASTAPPSPSKQPATESPAGSRPSPSASSTSSAAGTSSTVPTTSSEPAPVPPPPSSAPTIAFAGRELQIGATALGSLAGVEIWAVPAATLGLPGLLVLLWIAAQTVGALAWIPAVRRLRGDEDETQPE